MDRPDDSQKPTEAVAASQPARSKSSPSTIKTAYLILYNFTSALLWSAVLGRVLLITLLKGWHNVFLGTSEFTKWTQTLAGLEVLHAATGIVRAPLFTTLMQVASRFLLVWGIADNFPVHTARSPAYSTMLLAWSITEIIRYSYFTNNLFYGSVPKILTWLRYNTFFVLYPLGISSECWLVYKAIGPAGRLNKAWEWVLKLVLFVYVPGAYVLYTHMMAQRRKVLKGSREKKGQ